MGQKRYTSTTTCKWLNQEKGIIPVNAIHVYPQSNASFAKTQVCYYVCLSATNIRTLFKFLTVIDINQVLSIITD